jgi:hypothetical protein
MKAILVVLFVISSSLISFSQINQQSKAGQKSENSIKQQIIELHLEQRKFRPKLTLQNALKLAESYIEKEKIDISRYYLFEAKFTLCRGKDNQEPCWFFWWNNEDGILDDYIFIDVSIETGSVRRVPSI